MAKLSTNDISIDIGLLAGKQSIESLHFGPVAAEEIAFALSLFVAVANGQIAMDPSRLIPMEESSLLECQKVFAAFSSAGGSSIAARKRFIPSEPTFHHERTLEASFWMLWQHYRTDERRVRICARILNFYYLMERSRGAIVESWIELTPGTPETIFLHPAIIEAVATVPLHTDNLVDEDSFKRLVRSRFLDSEC